MRLTADAKQAITDRIVTGAATRFRAAGYDAVTLDHLMAEAGLTRGAFYAHFKSKSEVFAAVLRTRHPLIDMLRDRPGATPEALRAEMGAIFDDYLSPANLAEVFTGCTFAALTGDATRAGPLAKAAYADAWRDALKEMARGRDRASEGALSAALTLATGAVRSAHAAGDEELATVILSSARDEVARLLDQAPAA